MRLSQDSGDSPQDSLSRARGLLGPTSERPAPCSPRELLAASPLDGPWGSRRGPAPHSAASVRHRRLVIQRRTGLVSADIRDLQPQIPGLVPWTPLPSPKQEPAPFQLPGPSPPVSLLGPLSLSRACRSPPRHRHPGWSLQRMGPAIGCQATVSAILCPRQPVTVTPALQGALQPSRTLILPPRRLSDTQGKLRHTQNSEKTIRTLPLCGSDG